MAAIAAITRQPSLDKRGFEPFDAFVDAACYCGRLGDALAPGCAEGLAKLLGSKSATQPKKSVRFRDAADVVVVDRAPDELKPALWYDGDDARRFLGDEVARRVAVGLASRAVLTTTAWAHAEPPPARGAGEPPRKLARTDSERRRSAGRLE